MSNVYTDDKGLVWHPHSGFWSWKTATSLASAEARVRWLESELERRTTERDYHIGMADKLADLIKVLRPVEKEALL